MGTHKTYRKSDGSAIDTRDIDWTEFDGMSDEEALHRAKEDPDAPPLDQDELDKFKRVHPPLTEEKDANNNG